MSDVWTERCEELRRTIIELTPLAIESQGNASRLADLLPLINRLREVADGGVAGIDNPAYERWVLTAHENLAQMEEAARKGDAGAVWAAFADQRTGVNLLSTGCAGASGW